MTARYPAILACEDKTSNACPRLNVLNNISMEKAVAPCAANCAFNSGFTNGDTIPTKARFSTCSMSLTEGLRTLITTSCL